MILGLLGLSACGGRQAAAPLPSPVVTVEPSLPVVLAELDGGENPSAAATVSPTGTPASTVVPSRTPSPVPTATPTTTPSPTPTPIPTDTATPTPTPLHPLDIEALRRGTYPGSALTIEETLEPGANYDRYIASYLSEGLRIYALLTVPRGQEPEGGWPVILFNHGYIPPEQYRTTERYVAYVDALARQGYIILRSDYRGHGNSEGAPSSNYASPAYTVDVLNAIAAIQSYPGADANRIGMWGHSMGGGITLRIMVTTSDVKAGVIWAGTVASHADLLQRRWGSEAGGPSPLPTLDPESPRWSWLPEMLATHGSPEVNPEFYAAISPNSYLGDLSGPIQLHHGSADTSVPVSYIETLHAQMQAAGMPSELYVYPGDNHNISANFAKAMARSVQFFDAHVKGAGGGE